MSYYGSDKQLYPENSHGLLMTAYCRHFFLVRGSLNDPLKNNVRLVFVLITFVFQLSIEIFFHDSFICAVGTREHSVFMDVVRLKGIVSFS